MDLEDIENADISPIDTGAAKMMSLGAQWLVNLHEYLSSKPEIIVNRFSKAGIPQAIDAVQDL